MTGPGAPRDGGYRLENEWRLCVATAPVAGLEEGRDGRR